jgi:hypothetical protein
VGGEGWWTGVRQTGRCCVVGTGVTAARLQQLHLDEHGHQLLVRLVRQHLQHDVHSDRCSGVSGAGIRGRARVGSVLAARTRIIA